MMKIWTTDADLSMMVSSADFPTERVNAVICASTCYQVTNVWMDTGEDSDFIHEAFEPVTKTNMMMWVCKYCGRNTIEHRDDGCLGCGACDFAYRMVEVEDA
jgi:rRNA maturation endonuclease Nob1